MELVKDYHLYGNFSIKFRTPKKKDFVKVVVPLQGKPVHKREIVRGTVAADSSYGTGRASVKKRFYIIFSLFYVFVAYCIQYASTSSRH